MQSRSGWLTKPSVKAKMKRREAFLCFWQVTTRVGSGNAGVFSFSFGFKGATCARIPCHCSFLRKRLKRADKSCITAVPSLIKARIGPRSTGPEIGCSASGLRSAISQMTKAT